MGIFVGIDPGKSGGIAWITESGNAAAVRMPETERDLWDLLKGMFDQFEPKKVYLEKVGVMPGEGVSSAFSFGKNYGMLRGMLIATQMPFDDVRPLRWQKMFSLPTIKACGGSKVAKKNTHKAKAQQLFPQLKITHATADALLIAEYCRQREALTPD